MSNSIAYGRVVVFAGTLAFVVIGVGTGESQESPQRKQGPGQAFPGVYKARIEPHWFANNTRFWYRNDLRGGTKEFIVVLAAEGKRLPAFDHEKLAAGLSKAAAKDYSPTRLPFDRLEFIDDNKSVRFTIGDIAWKCDLATYECSKIAGETKRPPEPPDPAANVEHGEHDGADSLRPDGLLLSPHDANLQPPPRREPQRVDRSPDGKWTASIKSSNVYIRGADNKEIALTQDGRDGLAYGNLHWSPDSKTLVAFRIEPGENRNVYLIESSPKGGGRAVLHTRPYPLPGDKFASYELVLFDVANQKTIKPEVDKVDFGFPRLRWSKDGQSFMYQKVDRGHQRFRLIEVDAPTGSARTLIDEKSATFIWTAHTENVNLSTVTFLNKTDEIIYASERDGWRHLYLIDAKAGKIKNSITRGDYVVRGIDRIDEAKRQIWFRASGRNAEQDPYLIHFYRVDFDGSNLVALTEGNGNHLIQYSPDGAYLVDSYSRVDAPSVHELRRAADGKFVCNLEQADITELKATGWEAPEVFVAKGRDGTTDIWGIICRPRNFDPNKKYPVIESIYAGPQGSFVPKAFAGVRRFSNLTDLGFIVVQIDGMGTANRSKAFHDVCWHDLKDAGFPDRILWHQAAARKYSYYDIGRVGIYGTSAGGQNATGAVLFHPEFYQAAVSACGCHDNRMDKASWNEQWMGYPVGPQYAASSNIDNAHRLRGKLLLIVGEMDNNVPPESTMRLVDALIKAGKDFELIVVPGMGHSNGGAYGTRRLQDFFVRHLQDKEPPDRNAGKP